MKINFNTKIWRREKSQAPGRIRIHDLMRLSSQGVCRIIILQQLPSKSKNNNTSWMQCSQPNQETGLELKVQPSMMLSSNVWFVHYVMAPIVAQSIIWLNCIRPLPLRWLRRQLMPRSKKSGLNRSWARALSSFSSETNPGWCNNGTSHYNSMVELYW